MMQPEIRYTRTSDGVTIAYTRVGSGPEVLYSDFGIRHATYASGTYLLHKVLADVASVTYFDHPGVGASDRDVTDFSPPASLRAHEAVADASMADHRFTFIASGIFAFGPLYAAAHPERVERLICLDPVPSASAWFKAHSGDWSAARRVMASMVYPEGPPERQRWWSQVVRDSVSQDTWRAAAAAYQTIDQQASFARVRVPTLVVAGKREALRQHAARLAAVVPGGQVVVTEASGPAGDHRDGVRAVLEFMGIDPACVGGAPRGEAAVILFLDIVDSTALTESMGDAPFREKARALDTSLRAIIADAGGTTIDAKTLGDGVLATFGSAAQAIEGARRCLALSAASELGLHIGVHAGDVIREEENVFGGAVNIASRICGLSEAGEILVSDVVRGMARSSVRQGGVVFEDRGEREMKGVGEAVRVYAVRAEGG
jgi:class 3 adenylate cyclase/pimeloyl-ACP methyl ester carboxylesterase